MGRVGQIAQSVISQSDSTEFSGPRMGMPHRDHNLCADFLQWYDDRDGEVSSLTAEVSDEERYNPLRASGVGTYPREYPGRGHAHYGTTTMWLFTPSLPHSTRAEGASKRRRGPRRSAHPVHPWGSNPHEKNPCPMCYHCTTTGNIAGTDNNRRPGKIRP